MRAKEANEPPGPGKEQSSAGAWAGRVSPACQEHLILHHGETAAPWKRQKHTSDCQKKKTSKPSNTLPSTIPSLYVLLPLLKGYGFPINERLLLVLMSDMCLYQQEDTHLSPPSAVRGSLWFAVLA